MKDLIAQFRDIFVSDEMKNWLSVAAQDRLGRELTNQEKDLINFIGDNLQQAYCRQWRKLEKEGPPEWL